MAQYVYSNGDMIYYLITFYFTIKVFRIDESVKEVGTGHRRSLVLFLFMFFGFILFQEKVGSICLIFLITAHINLFCVCNNLIDILIWHISFFFSEIQTEFPRVVSF